jgi:hypothetical protein
LEFASRQTGFLHQAALWIVGPVYRKCPGVVVVAVDKITERCKQATESLNSGRSRRRAGDCAIEKWPAILPERRRNRLIHPLSNVRAWRAATAPWRTAAQGLGEMRQKPARNAPPMNTPVTCNVALATILRVP